MGRNLALGRQKVVAKGGVGIHQRMTQSKVGLPELPIALYGQSNTGGIGRNLDQTGLTGSHRGKASPVRVDGPRKDEPTARVGAQLGRRFPAHDDVVHAEPSRRSIRIQPRGTLGAVGVAYGFRLAFLPVSANELDF